VRSTQQSPRFFSVGECLNDISQEVKDIKESYTCTECSQGLSLMEETKLRRLAWRGSRVQAFMNQRKAADRHPTSPRDIVKPFSH
jgi:hypothetical protein